MEKRSGLKPLHKFIALLAASGAEGAAKFLEICNAFKNIKSMAIVTRSAQKFFSKLLAAKEVLLHTDEDDWNTRVGNNLHLELAEWADTLVIVLASANTLAKMFAASSGCFGAMK